MNRIQVWTQEDVVQKVHPNTEVAMWPYYGYKYKAPHSDNKYEYLH